MTRSTPPGYVGVEDLAERLGVAPSTVRGAIRSERHPKGYVPAPDLVVGRTNLWLPESVADITRPDLGRPKRATDDSEHKC